MKSCTHMYGVEVQRYMIWVYRYIAALVSRYSDILYDTVKCKLADFTDKQNFLPKLQFSINTK